MKQLILKSTIFLSVIFWGGCASTYKPINPPAVYYSAHDLKDGISFSYKFDVLREKGNKKYYKKEYKKGLKVIAVKVTNNTDTTITIGQDVAFYYGRNELMLVDQVVMKKSIKQIAPAYLPYLLLTFLRLNVYTETSSDSYPIGLAIGPGLAVGNMICAGTANDNLLSELTRYSLINKEIKRGETAYGIIGIRTLEYPTITLEYRYE